MVSLVQMLEILNIKVIWMLMYLVIVYAIIAHNVQFLTVSITLGMPIFQIIIISGVMDGYKRFERKIRNVLKMSLP